MPRGLGAWAGYRGRAARTAGLVVITLCPATFTACTAAASAPPPIRLAKGQAVPACATPERLDAFLARHNRRRGYTLAPRFRDIARWYRTHGQRFRVRWDYAFFQMLLETNFLSYRRGNGKWGDVDPKQNNFAGLGTTGGGVPGDSYPDVSTGVLAQIQHLVVYSGEHLDNPVGHRTRLKQDVILKSVAPIVAKRAVTFADLARRWAADRHYGRSIQAVANRFREEFCNGASYQARTVAAEPPPLPAAQPAKTGSTAGTVTTTVAAAAPRPAVAPRACRVQVAGYAGSDRTLLIENVAKGTVQLTALDVLPGFEHTMVRDFIRAYAPEGRTLGAFSSRDAAVAEAQAICRKLAKRS